jgi:hypothetical protein
MSCTLLGDLPHFSDKRYSRCAEYTTFLPTSGFCQHRSCQTSVEADISPCVKFAVLLQLVTMTLSAYELALPSGWGLHIDLTLWPSQFSSLKHLSQSKAFVCFFVWNKKANRLHDTILWCLHHETSWSLTFTLLCFGSFYNNSRYLNMEKNKAKIFSSLIADLWS